MILYFSGTGNSRYTAELISSVTGDSIISLNEIIKTNAPLSFHSNSPFVIVCPTYAWRIPRIVEDAVIKGDFSGSKEIYFVLTCGDGAGNAYKYAKLLSDNKGFVFKGLKAVVMPENYIAMFSVPDEKESEAIIERAKPVIKETAEKIKNGEDISQSSSLLGKFLSGPVNGIFYGMFVSDRGFYTTDKCVSCGKCAELCPLNNITIKDGKPHWGGSCTHCMACICRCPSEAIEYKNKSKGKRRYSI